MSAVPTLTETAAPTTIGRAFDELVEGLQELADGLRRGDVACFAAPRRWEPTIVLPAEPAPPPNELTIAHVVGTMAAEVAKTGLVVLVAYQGLLMALPSPDRPRFAAPAGQASAAVPATVPSVVAAAHAAAVGSLREVEVDVDGRAGRTLVP